MTIHPSSSTAAPLATGTVTARLEWSTIAFFVAFHGLALLAPWFFSWSALAIALSLHWLCGSLGICLGYHRFLSHRGLQLPRWLAYIVVTLGALALQGGPIFWVAAHRRHHAHTETEQDPHSARRGFWWSHLLWLVYQRPAFFEASQYTPFARDRDRDPYYHWLNRYFLVPQLLLAVLLLAVGGWSWVIYGIFVRTVALWHSTWLINSATHLVGYRNFDANDDSRNVWWVAILTYGEGWHNNHHAYPRVAQAGWRWWEFDPTWWVILIFERLGWATKVVRFSEIVKV